MHRWAVILCAGLLALAARATSSSRGATRLLDHPPLDHVSVIHMPRTATTNHYDPRHPAAALPTTFPDEVGVTVSEFGCLARVVGTVIDESRRGRTALATVRVDSIQITLRLDVTEWIAQSASTTQNAGNKILSHENGHRLIAEHFYAHADIPATAIGCTMIGRRFSATGADLDTAASDALNVAASEIARQYMLAVRDPSEQVQETYDRITAHGTNAVEELNAIDQAMHDATKVQEAMDRQAVKSGSD